MWIEGERVRDVTAHPTLKPIIDVRARMYDMAFEAAHRDTLTYVEDNRRKSVFNRPPTEQKDWADKPAAVDAVLKEIGGVVTRVGDETVGEMWSLQDGRDALAETDGRFAGNIDRHVAAVRDGDLFHVSANTDPKGDRSLAPQDQDPDMLVHVTRETDAGIVIRGAKQAVRQKLAGLVCYREGINAHLTASIAMAERSPAGLPMPQQSMLFGGRVFACSQLPAMMHIARELCGGQICVTPNAASFEGEGSGGWLRKFYTLNQNWQADGRRKILAFARDLLNSDYAGHRLAFAQFAQAPHFNHLAAVCNSLDFSGPLDFVRRAADLSPRVAGAS